MSLLQMSLAGAVMILCIAALRALTIHRLPKVTFLALWGVALARLLVPYSLPSAFSVYSLLARLTPAAKPVVCTPAPPVMTVTPGTYVPVTPAVPAAPQTVPLIDPWLVVWLVGALACALYFVVAYGQCRREFRASLPVEREEAMAWLREHPLRRPMEIRQSDKITAPLTYGVLRPVILMPKTTDWEDLDTVYYALAHEYVHIRRFDAVTKLVLTAALCVHWFNPAVWMMVVLANRDLELSCDEAVIHRFGMDTKAAYAAALLRMEEVRNGFAPLYNHFSKNAMKERMVAIMKLKRTSSLAILMAAVLVVGMTTAFATSKQPAELRNPADTHLSQTAEQDFTVTSYADPADEKLYYSSDGGKTWIALRDAEFRAGYDMPEVEWWTAEEYEAWLENEKIQLQSIIGERCWTSSDGWFTWDQEKVDEAIAMYEGILEDIKNGMLYSKTIHGEADTSLVLSMGSGDLWTATDESIATSEDFAQYAPYGLTWDSRQQALFWNGQRVRHFVDGAEVDGGMAIRIEYADAELKGEVDVRAVRERVQNADGSVDPVGPLTGLEAYSQAEFDARTFPEPTLEAVTYADIIHENARDAAETQALLRPYVSLGLHYRMDPLTGAISMSWQDKPVHSIFDAEKGVWIAHNMRGWDLGPDAVDLEAVYENGQLTGLKESECRHAVEAGYLMEGNGSEAVAFAFAQETEEMGFQSGRATLVMEGDTAAVTAQPGMTLAQRFKRYAPFGITYEEAEGASGAGNVYYNGRLVSHFTDITPDGGAFSFTSTQCGGISVRTVYDSDGKLAGVEVVAE